ncbi:fatty acyl-AMP ligase [Nocardiopsis sp. MG754419]|uniref:fatty acyl-AMP ligase n=1 Tax=Nocardiopsis sp. MG754419 TaxID=2259865 RepID=UPI001BAC78FD|nr:fatty acyl-AMP ligase [Nocardiopsis sp. MG754419]MBR8743439.1 hypothetical protein [Nocardiopsis sp. MG754419]
MSTPNPATTDRTAFLSLPALVRAHALEGGPRTAFVFRDFPRSGGGNAVDTELGYADLDRRARSVAAALRRRVGPGDRVAVLCPHTAGYVTAFLGCLYAGVIAVPLHAPEPFRGPERVHSVLEDCDPSLILTTGRTLAATRTMLKDTRFADLPLCEVEDLAVGDEDHDGEPPRDPDATAYLQYTSGSTGSPAGVRVSHGNLVAACGQLATHFPEARTVVSWVPFFHDMGLVFGLAAPLAAGHRSVQLSPMAFVQDPLRWLRAIGDHAAEWTVTPNFGLEHCLGRHPDDAPDVDLSSLGALSVAGEPVRSTTLDRFAAEYAPAGLRRSALAPCYGLAEATLAVTATPLGEGPTTVSVDRGALAEGEVVPVTSDPAGPDAIRLVSCGTPKQGVEVRIVGPDGARVESGAHVGRVWTRGPNNADGYWRNPERSAERFRDVDGLRWLDTGDLGFVHAGSLFVVGRSDDVLVIRGRNHYPDDIEATVRRVVPGTAAVFTTDDEAGPRVVVVLEPRDAGPTDGAHAIAKAVRDAVQRGHGLSIHALLPVRRGTIPRTTSGKVQRGRCRERYLQGRFGDPL